MEGGGGGGGAKDYARAHIMIAKPKIRFLPIEH